MTCSHPDCTKRAAFMTKTWPWPKGRRYVPPKIVYSCAEHVPLSCVAPARQAPRRPEVAIPEGFDWTQTVVAIAVQLGVSLYWARKFKIESGTPSNPSGVRKGTKAYWHQKAPHDFDWSKRDTDLAKGASITRERIRQLRKAAGLPSSREIPKVHPAWWQQIDPALTHAENSRKLGQRIVSVRRAVKILGLALPCGKECKYDWASVDWSRRTCDIAEEFGCKRSYVSKQRAKANATPCGS